MGSKKNQEWLKNWKITQFFNFAQNEEIHDQILKQ